MGQWNHRRRPHPGEPGALRSEHPGTHPACSAAGYLPAPKYRRFGLSGRRRPRRRYPGQESGDKSRFRSRGSGNRGALGWRGQAVTDLVSKCVLRRDVLQLLQSVGRHVHGTRFTLLQAPLLVVFLVGCRERAVGHSMRRLTHYSSPGPGHCPPRKHHSPCTCLTQARAYCSVARVPERPLPRRSGGSRSLSSRSAVMSSFWVLARADCSLLQDQRKRGYKH